MADLKVSFVIPDAYVSRLQTAVNAKWGNARDCQGLNTLQIFKKKMIYEPIKDTLLRIERRMALEASAIEEIEINEQ